MSFARKGTILSMPLTCPRQWPTRQLDNLMAVSWIFPSTSLFCCSFVSLTHTACPFVYDSASHRTSDEGCDGQVVSPPLCGCRRWISPIRRRTHIIVSYFPLATIRIGSAISILQSVDRATAKPQTAPMGMEYLHDHGRAIVRMGKEYLHDLNGRANTLDGMPSDTTYRTHPVLLFAHSIAS